MKIGIIGSGIAGLSAGWLLANSGHHVTIFERGPRAGMGAHSIDFAGSLSGKSKRLDHSSLIGNVPSRMFNSQLWPSLYRLYEQAAVPIEPVDNRQSFCDSSGQLLFKLELPYQFTTAAADLLNSQKRALLTELARFRSVGLEAIECGIPATQTFKEFLSLHPIDKDFEKQFLFPALSSTVFTCPYRDLLEYPAATVLNALSRIGSAASDSRSPLMKTVNGSNDVVQRLLKPVEQIHFSSEVHSVRRSDDCIKIATADLSASFDHLIIATQANQVESFASKACHDAAKTLNSFQYVNVPVVVHTDRSFMPENEKDWSTFNFATNESTEMESSLESSMCTVWMNRFHTNWPETTPVFQTIFPTRMPSESNCIHSVELQRPVVNSQTDELLKRLERLHQQADRRIWFVGSYAAAGVPLLESAVVSSLNVCKKIAQLSLRDGYAIEH
jgi:predicted NAD/FAD-binding protein